MRTTAGVAAWLAPGGRRAVDPRRGGCGGARHLRRGGGTGSTPMSTYGRPPSRPSLLDGPAEHIGSTSVPGLPAKPIVDLMAPIASLSSGHAEADSVLADAGWQLVPPELDNRPWRRFYALPHGTKRAAHLHLVEPVESALAPGHQVPQCPQGKTRSSHGICRSEASSSDRTRRRSRGLHGGEVELHRTGLGRRQPMTSSRVLSRYPTVGPSHRAG